MPRVVFERMGKYGIIRDMNPNELPFEAWSDGQNVRFYEDCIQRFLGHSTIWTPVVDPWWLLPVSTDVQLLWLYAGAAKVYAVGQDGVHGDITRTVGGDYTPNFQFGWNGGVFNSIPVINNGVDVPQMWTPPNLGTALQALTAWPPTYRARVLRPLRNFLVALDITKAGVRYPLNVLWSHSAVPGNVPSSWDITDVTKDAGENALAETGGFVIDLFPLRDVGVVYKEDSTWLMQYVGGAAIFRFARLKKFGGIYTRHCVKSFELNGEKHFALTKDDMVVHDGQNGDSVADKRIRRWFFNQIDVSNYQRTHVVHNPAKWEMWCCIPNAAGQCFKAAVFNYKDNRWGIRELPLLNFAESGQINPNSQPVTWDSDPNPWDTDQSAWDDRPYSPVSDRVMMGVPGAGKQLFLGDDTNQFNLANFNSYVARTGLSVVGQTKEGEPIYDTVSIKLVSEVWPRIEGTAGTTVLISIGTQDEPNDPVTWTGPFPFVIGTDKKINPYVSGKLLGIKFEFNGNAFFRLFGFDMEISIIGKGF